MLRCFVYSKGLSVAQGYPVKCSGGPFLPSDALSVAKRAPSSVQEALQSPREPFCSSEGLHVAQKAPVKRSWGSFTKSDGPPPTSIKK